MLSEREIRDEDFKSFAEEGKIPFPEVPDKLCQWHGLSVFTSIEDARHHIELFGQKRHVAMADLINTDGRAKRTPNKKFPAHVTWWPSENTDRKAKFQIV